MGAASLAGPAGTQPLPAALPGWWAAASRRTLTASVAGVGRRELQSEIRPVFFQFSLKPLERHHPHRLARFGLPALTLSVPAQSELSIFVVQYLYTLLKCFMRLTAAVTNQLFGKNKPQSI